MKFFILVVNDGCAPCHEELALMEEHNKPSAINLEEDRFMIVSLSDSGHLPWVELLQPMSTPSLFTIESGTLAILQEYKGFGCFDATMRYFNIDMPWNPQGDLFSDIEALIGPNEPSDAPTEFQKTVVEDDPDSQEVAE